QSSSRRTMSGPTGPSVSSGPKLQKLNGPISNRVNTSGLTNRNIRARISNQAMNGKGQGKQKGPNQRQRDKIQAFMEKNAVSGTQKGALTRLQSGENLTDEDRSTLTNMLASDSRLDPEVRDIIKQGLEEDLQNKRQEGSRQTQRYLKVKNET